ncbi:MAG: bacteriophage abortive infection AbiH family protein [Lachnospiraceae bacterium]|nr:bacteriophage abortive infection AbiH family protein [Lachnospiraceae bacterium]
MTFNYTNVLDRIIGLYDEKTAIIAKHQGQECTRSNKIGQIIHIHGTTDEEMILGVNDAEQIGNDLLKKDGIFLDTFIKRRMNNSIGQRKTEKAVEIINKSHIICVFGMSIGNTDKMWWEALVEWLVSNEYNKLIIFWKGFENALEKKLPSKTIRLNDRII